MKLASFDLEIAKILPEETENLMDHSPLGITCAAIALSDKEDIRYWYDTPQFSKEKSVSLVRDLQELVRDGYNLLTWNGAGFDFQVLAQESGLVEECGILALNHIDMMLFVTFQKGWFLSLEKALLGAGLSGKLKQVDLSNGTTLEDMSGAMAPKLWAEGEYRAVIKYLKEDVIQPLKLAQSIQSTKKIQWTSNRGNPMAVSVEKLYTVKECFKFPVPDTSWMDDPPTRDQFVSWMLP